jgi:prevent-host-death family protein
MIDTEDIEVGSFEAKNRLSALIEMAAQGKQIWITKHGHRMALLSSGIEQEAQTHETLVADFQSLRASSSTDGSSIKDLIDEGRL